MMMHKEIKNLSTFGDLHHSPKSHVDAWRESASFASEENSFHVDPFPLELVRSSSDSWYSSPIADFVPFASKVTGGSGDIDELDDMIAKLDLGTSEPGVHIPFDASFQTVSFNEMAYHDTGIEYGGNFDCAADEEDTVDEMPKAQEEAPLVHEESYGSLDTYTSGESAGSSEFSDEGILANSWVPELHAAASFLLLVASGSVGGDEVEETPPTEEYAFLEDQMQSPPTIQYTSQPIPEDDYDSGEGAASVSSATDDSSESEVEERGTQLDIPSLGVAVRPRTVTTKAKKIDPVEKAIVSVHNWYENIFEKEPAPSPPSVPDVLESPLLTDDIYFPVASWSDIFPVASWTKAQAKIQEPAATTPPSLVTPTNNPEASWSDIIPVASWTNDKAKLRRPAATTPTKTQEVVATTPATPVTPIYYLSDDDDYEDEVGQEIELPKRRKRSRIASRLSKRMFSWRKGQTPLSNECN